MTLVDRSLNRGDQKSEHGSNLLDEVAVRVQDNDVNGLQLSTMVDRLIEIFLEENLLSFGSTVSRSLNVSDEKSERGETVTKSVALVTSGAVSDSRQFVVMALTLKQIHLEEENYVQT